MTDRPAKRAREAEHPVYLVVDLNNIRMGAARHTPDGRASDVINVKLSLDHDALLRTVLRGRELADGYFIASGIRKRPLLDHLTNWCREQSLKFQNKTSNADDAILARTQEIITRSGGPCTIIMLTGDGAQNDGGVNFPEVMRRALEVNPDLKWEQWSWFDACHQVYMDMSIDRFKLCFLDYYKNVLVRGLNLSANPTVGQTNHPTNHPTVGQTNHPTYHPTVGQTCYLSQQPINIPVIVIHNGVALLCDKEVVNYIRQTLAYQTPEMQYWFSQVVGIYPCPQLRTQVSTGT